MPGIMLITYMHCDLIGTSTKWYRNNFYKWGKWGYNGLKLCPILPRRWVSWDLSQWPPWFSDSKICELDNTMLFQNWASSSVPSHPAYMVTSWLTTPLRVDTNTSLLLLRLCQFHDNFSMSPAVLRVYLIFVSLCYGFYVSTALYFFSLLCVSCSCSPGKHLLVFENYL